MKKIIFSILFIFLITIPLTVKSQVLAEAIPNTTGSNGFPFGSTNNFINWAPFLIAEYRNIDAFEISAGDLIQFDNITLSGSEPPVDREIYFSRTTANGSGIPIGWIKMVSINNSNPPVTGNTIRGDYDLTFISETNYSFAGGGFMIAVGVGQSSNTSGSGSVAATNFRANPNPLGKFVRRIYNVQTLRNGTAPSGTTNNGNVMGFRLSIPNSINASVAIDNGNLVITDPDDGRDDTLSIVVEGTNYRITDPTNAIAAGDGATQDGDDILVPIASVTGNIQVNTLAGDDMLTLDFSGGDFPNEIVYDGGLQNGGDAMTLIGVSPNGTFNTVEHIFINANDGSVAVSGNSTISYVGLEPIIDKLDVNDRIFTFTGGAETITLQDATATPGSNFIDSTLGESVTFANPTGSLTVNAGSGNDTVNIQGVDAAFDADLNVNGDDATDNVRFQTNETNVGSGAIEVNVERIIVFADVTTTGDISFTTEKDIFLTNNAVVQSTDGDITILAGINPLPGDNFVGVFIGGNAEVKTTGTGNVSVTGTGFGAGANFRAGIEMQAAGKLLTIGSGSITLTGTGAINGNFASHGFVIFDNARVESTGGGIIINATGRGTNQFNTGVASFGNATIADLNGGDITITAIGGNGSFNNYGFYWNGTNANIITTDGDITIIASTSATAIGSLNVGAFLDDNSSITSTGLGSISITGVGASGTFDNQGIRLTNAASVSTIDGDLIMKGSGGTNTEGRNYGYTQQSGASVNATGNGNINIIGNGGTGTEDLFGVYFLGNPTAVTTVDGEITIKGIGGVGTGGSNDGVQFLASTVQTIGLGNINISGTGGSGVFRNTGVTFFGSNMTTANGSITVKGTGTGTESQNYGVRITGFPNFQANGNGAIDITGTGGNGTGALNIGVSIPSGTIRATGTGMISIVGTGGTGSLNASGVIMNNPTSMETNGGGIQITGMAGTAPGDVNYGFRAFGGVLRDTNAGNITINGASNSSTTGRFNDGVIMGNGFVAESFNGDISLTGTAATLNDSDINILDDNVTLTAGGTITATGLLSEINTPSGIPTTTTFTATETIINGVLAPGQSPGQMTVSGDFTMAADDTYEVEVNDFNDFGSDYDQVAVTGEVDVTGASLTLVDNTTETGQLCDQITIIDNDGSDAIIGEFAGFPEGTDIPFNGELWRINYAAGDGNDVVLAFNPGMVAAPICMDITVELDASGNASITPADVDGGTPMGCDFDSLSIDVDSFTCDDIGDNDVVLTVTDIFGNTNSCTATVTIEDNIAPIIACAMDVEASTNPDSCFATVNFNDPLVVDNCGTGDVTITQTVGMPSGSMFPVGVSQIAFDVTDASGNTSQCSFTITVTDDTAPVAVCQDITVELDGTGNVTITPSQLNGGSTDNCNLDTSMSSIDIDTFGCADVGDNTVTLTVSDSSGNTATCTATVTVVDNTAPVVTCNDITVELGTDGTVTLDPTMLDGGSTDACGIATLTATPAVLDCGNLGVTEVTLTATDVNGNSSSCTALVTVEDNIAPILVCQEAVIELGADGTATIDPIQLLDLSNPLDNCGIEPLMVDVTEVDCSDIGNTITVTVTAMDASGNTSSCTTTITVVDVSGPVFDQASLPVGPIVRMINPATGIYRLEDFTVGVTATDGCSELRRPIAVSQSPFAGTELDEGTYDITITAMDESGNDTDYVFELQVQPALGVEDTNLSSLTLYPNPASNQITLSNPNGLQLDKAAIYDLQGRLIQNIDLTDMLSEKTIDVSSLQSATYMFVISSENGLVTKQIIKE